ncbi:aspartate/tyrosine/aromatic aminotransferase [Thaumarchaeota archaeon SCGC AB-539-E09]|nr:aspartate/tyrosine/aromatic aminotransferase [Thaumarchaeota archaeon SCGC AB-539-E09]
MKTLTSDRIKILSPEITSSAAQFDKLRSTMKRAIDPQDSTGFLEFGNADAGRDPFNPEVHIRQAAWDAMENPGKDLVYTPTQGLLEVREAIAEKCERENDFEVDHRKEVQITVGTQMAIFCTTQSLLNPGDKVLIPDPDYSGYQRIVKYSGGVPVSFPFTEDSDGQTRFDVEAMEKVASPDIKLMMFTNPNNPGGYLLQRDDLEAIAEIAEKNDFLVFADDLYEKLVYDGHEHISFASLPGMMDRTITIMGVSKTESMQMFRIGYVIAPHRILQHITKLVSAILIRSSYISQKALQAFLNEPKKFRDMRLEIHRKARDYVWKELNKIDGIRCNKPMGTSYVFPNHREINPSSYDFAVNLLEKGLVQLNPGLQYGPETSEGHQRFCFASPMDRLKEGIRRIKAVRDEL